MMSCFRMTRYSEKHLAATDNTLRYAWFTNWLLATGVDAVRPVTKVKNHSGANNFQWQPAIQTASVRPDNPNAPETLDTLQTNNGERCIGSPGLTTLTNPTQSNQWFRLGVAYKSSAASTEQADVGFQASWTQLAGLVGRREIQMDVADAGTHTAVVTRWFPASFVAKVKIAYFASYTGNTSLTLNFATQTAQTSIQQPGSWATLGSTITFPAGANVEGNTTDQSFTTTDMWMRIGIQYYNSATPSTLASAVLRAIVSTRG